MKYLPLFLTGFLQVFFVAINTYFIGKEKYAAVFCIGIVISLIWTYNVKRAAIGSNLERWIYATGAGVGAVSGLKVSVIINQM
jgi:hypothetical protein